VTDEARGYIAKYSIAAERESIDMQSVILSRFHPKWNGKSRIHAQGDRIGHILGSHLWSEKSRINQHQQKNKNDRYMGRRAKKKSQGTRGKHTQ
jgi:hypothetical protein